MLNLMTQSLIKTTCLFIFLARTVQSEDRIGPIKNSFRNVCLAKNSQLQQRQQKRLDGLQQQAYYSALDALSQSPTSPSPPSIHHSSVVVEHPSPKLTNNLPVQGSSPAKAAKIDFPDPVNDALWCAKAGKTLKEEISKWESIAGWRVQWNSDYDYPILAEVCFKGSFEQIMGDVIDAYRHAEHPFYLDLYPKQQLAVVSN